MTKPTDLPTWDSNETNTVTVVAGHTTDGYADDEIPTAAETNKWMNIVGRWVTWLDSLFDVGGTYNAQSGGNIVLTGDAHDAWGITTAYIVGDNCTNVGNQYECITGGTSAGAGGPTTTAADITDGTVHWKYVGIGDGQGRYFHGDESVTLTFNAINDQSGGTFSASGYFTLGNGGTARLPLAIPAGRRIKQVIVSCMGNAAATLNTYLEQVLTDGTASAIGSDSRIPSAAWTTNLFITIAGETGRISSDESYEIRFGSATAGVLEIGNVCVVYDYTPPPA